MLFAGNAGGLAFFADTWEWDGTEWTQMADTGPTARQGHAIAFHSKNKRVVLFGGYTNTNQTGQYPADTWSWDGTEWTQEQDTGPAGRELFGLAYDAVRDRLILFGGYGNGGTLNDTWEWDGARWTQVADTGPDKRYGHKMVFDGTRVLLFGGVASGYVGDTWSWDGQHWTKIQDMGVAPRAFSAMTYDSNRGRSVLFGGSNMSGVLGDTWELYEH